MDQPAYAQLQQNKQKLQSIIKCVIFCRKQNIPLHGHWNDSQYFLDTNQNPGNSQRLLEFRVNAGDNILKHQLEIADRRATSRSKTTQNELI